MEYLDVFDKSGKWKKKVIKKGEIIASDEYLKVTECWIKNKKGEYLIQKRSENKKLFANMWYCSAGGLLNASESEKDGMQREIFEELGICIDQSEMKLKKIIVDGNFIFYIYLIEAEVDTSLLKLQSYEVSDAKWASLDEISEMIKRKEFVALDYYDKFFGRKM